MTQWWFKVMGCDRMSEMCEPKYLNAIPDVVSLKAHMFCMLYSAEHSNDTNSKPPPSLLEKYASMVHSTIYQDVLIKQTLMELFKKCNYIFLRPVCNIINISQSKNYSKT